MTVGKIGFVLFLVWGWLIILSMIYEDRAEIISMLKSVIQRPLAEPGGTWLVALTAAFIMGGVLYNIGFGFQPLYLMLGCVMVVPMLYIMYAILKRMTIGNLKAIFDEFSWPPVIEFKIIFCLGAPFVTGYMINVIKHYCLVSLPAVMSYPVDGAFYLILVANVFLPFFLWEYYETILERLTTCMPTRSEKE